MNENSAALSAPKVSHTLRRSDYRYVAMLLAVAAAICGCGRAINRSAERRIRDILPDLIGTAREYRVHVSGPDTDTARGRIQGISVDGRDINLANGLLLDSLHLEMAHITADFEHKQIRSVESAHFTASIGETALDEYFAGESPEGETLRNVRISIREGSVAISGERVVLGLGVPFKAYGPLRLTGPQKIELDPSRLVVVGIPITGAPLRFIKKKFESAMDLSSLPVPMRLDGVTMHSHKLVLSGTPDIPAILQLRKEEGTRK
jgi:LmeA-like phospholipid-binding